MPARMDILHLTVTKYLVLERKCDPTVRDNAGLTPVEASALANASDIVDFLREIDPSLPPFNKGATEKSNAHLESSELSSFISGLKGNLSNLILLRSAGDGSVEEVRRALSRIGSSEVPKGPNGETALHLAAYSGHLEIVELLVSEHEYDVNAQDNDGRTRDCATYNVF